MGSEGPSNGVTVHITGFKKFHGVLDNPTESIVKNIKPFLEQNGVPKGLTIGTCTVLETAGNGAVGTLYKLLEASLAGTKDGSSNCGQVIWVHFGVNSGATRFAIEKQAINEANFRCPDELGWKPQRVPIVPSDGSISRIRTTNLPVKEIARELEKRGFADVAVSDDAGRFVCNYVYYHSLRFAEKKGIKSLFVHVPLFATIGEETQMKFVKEILDVLSFLN
ncbi:hypothetical protein LUZ60_003456 [Juncus effusus]|nr:hypothetical protein LUZ60_003456 [Juncus effusus]